MKKLITEEERVEIRNMHSLDETLFSDVLDKIKSSDTVQNIKKKFEDLLGIKLGDDETSDSDSISTTKPSSSDDEIYEKILKGIGAPVTNENMKFLYAWRQGEGAKAKYNPFNTTRKKGGTTFFNCLKKENGKCVAGVKNYKSEKEGIDATIETLKLDYYDCITDGLKNDIGAKKIAKNCRTALKTWGTGDLVAKVLDGNKLNPPAISKSEVKTTA